MEKKKSLLEKYEIPINHLDFVYIKKCEDAREMEKIVHILRSGQEGYFPDLTKCAEDKLKELKPNSKLFRCEEELRKRDCLDAKELKPIYDWNLNIKAKDNELAKLCKDAAPIVNLPPLRKCGKIAAEKSTTEETTKTTNPVASKKSEISNENRIKSTDYTKWDKYDPDVEILRMDLDEERMREEIERKNRKNAEQKCDETPKIIEITDEEATRIECEQNESKLLAKLSQIEREKYAEERRLYGNEYFRAKEYENAIKEYTRAIHFNPANASRAYNNRAIAYIKLKDYLSAIEDCEQCLKLDPKNVKALLRLADANYGYGRRRDSYDEYLKVLTLDPSNTSALKAVDKLRAEFGELPPENATRMIITEVKSEKVTKTDKNQSITTHKKPKPIKAPSKEYDLAELVKPNRVVKSKLTSAAEALGTITNMAKATHKVSQHQAPVNQLQNLQPPSLKPTSTFEEMRLPITNAKPKDKILIQEI